MSQKGVQYVEKNIRQDQAALQELIQLGARGTPTTVIDGEVIVGFDRKQLTALLDLGEA